MTNWKLCLYCVLAVAALPLTVLVAIFAACGGDAMLLRVLRGKSHG